MTMRPVDVYNKLRSGDPLTNAEIELGRTHFRKVADGLSLCGPVFHLAWCEANRAADSFEGFYLARQRKS